MLKGSWLASQWESRQHNTLKEKWNKVEESILPGTLCVLTSGRLSNSPRFQQTERGLKQEQLQGKVTQKDSVHSKGSQRHFTTFNIQYVPRFQHALNVANWSCFWLFSITNCLKVEISRDSYRYGSNQRHTQSFRWRLEIIYTLVMLLIFVFSLSLDRDGRLHCGCKVILLRCHC